MLGLRIVIETGPVLRGRRNRSLQDFPEREPLPYRLPFTNGSLNGSTGSRSRTGACTGAASVQTVRERNSRSASRPGCKLCNEVHAILATVHYLPSGSFDTTARCRVLIGTAGTVELAACRRPLPTDESAGPVFCVRVAPPTVGLPETHAPCVVVAFRQKNEGLLATRQEYKRRTERDRGAAVRPTRFIAAIPRNRRRRAAAADPRFVLN